jgi:hypothetical protein
VKRISISADDTRAVIRALVATNPDVRTAVGRIFAEEFARAQKRLANVDGAETGVVSCHQNFGGSLNAHALWHDIGHDIAVDGVFEKVDEGVRFHEAKAPEKADVEDVARRGRDARRSGDGVLTEGQPLRPWIEAHKARKADVSGTIGEASRQVRTQRKGPVGGVEPNGAFTRRPSPASFCLAASMGNG